MDVVLQKQQPEVMSS